MISVVIRSKNQADALSFLLKNLTERYSKDVSEIIVIDNLSSDNSEVITKQFGARFVTINKFSYGGSANMCAKEAKGDIIVIFSAHSYPVSHDFFKLIKQKFQKNLNLAGLRCLHNSNDYRNYINNIPAIKDPNKSGLIFSGSAFSKVVWEKYPFNEDVATFEDKEWTTRVLKAGYDIEFVESIFCYQINRSKKQIYSRFKNDVVGNYQLWHKNITFATVCKGLIMSFKKICVVFLVDCFYALKRCFFQLKFIFNKPNKF